MKIRRQFRRTLSNTIRNYYLLITIYCSFPVSFNYKNIKKYSVNFCLANK